MDAPHLTLTDPRPGGSAASMAPADSIGPLPPDLGPGALTRAARIDGPADLPPGTYAEVSSERFGYYIGRVRGVDRLGLRGIGLEVLSGGVLHRMITINAARIDTITTCTPAEAWAMQPEQPGDDTPRHYVIWGGGALMESGHHWEFVGPFPDHDAAEAFAEAQDASDWRHWRVMLLRPSTLRRPPTVVPAPRPAPPELDPSRVEYVEIPRADARPWSDGLPAFVSSPVGFGLQRLSSGAFSLKVLVGQPKAEDGEVWYYCYPMLAANAGHWRHMTEVPGADFIAFWQDLPSLADVMAQIDADGRPGPLRQYRVADEPAPGFDAGESPQDPEWDARNVGSGDGRPSPGDFA